MPISKTGKKTKEFRIFFGGVQDSIITINEDHPRQG
jgi:hypothetical protein